MRAHNDTTPRPITRANKKSGAARAPKIDEARAAKKSNNSAALASEIDVNKPLTDKQKLFVQNWAKGDSIPNAALRAGYSDDGLAYRMVRQPNILAYKAKFEAKYEAASQMSRKKVMDMLLESYDMAKLTSEPATMVSAAREIGKMCGYYAPVEHKVKVDVTGNIVVDRLNGMSDAELLKVITSGNTLELPNVEDLGDEP